MPNTARHSQCRAVPSFYFKRKEVARVIGADEGGAGAGKHGRDSLHPGGRKGSCTDSQRRGAPFRGR